MLSQVAITSSVPMQGAAHSRFVQRVRRRYAQEMPLLSVGPPTSEAMQQTLEALLTQGLHTGAALRVLRQLVIERLATLECEERPENQASLALVMQAMTDLAELALNVAWQETQQQLDAAHGPPQWHHGAGQPPQTAQMWIVGMGKLGARELNVSSDIDLIYVYDQDGQTAGRADGGGRISNHEYFAQQVKAIHHLIGQTTEHGFVFRVDLALRPNGSSGPAALSAQALAGYFQSQGREWERFAWLKSRIVAPAQSIQDGSAHALRASVLPFVFRRYLDYNVFDSLRLLHRQIREQAQRRCAGHPERMYDVKLSRGGIREIEFTVQLLQVVRGGQFPELRTRPTLKALQRLAHAGLMPQPVATALAQAYDFLRRVEHRIQYLDDQQTHTLPTQDEDLRWIAQTLGYANESAFLSALDGHRERVAHEFDLLLGGASACKRCTGTTTTAALDLDVLMEQLSAQWPEKLAARLQLWRDNARVRGLREDARARLAQLVQRTHTWLENNQVTEEAALRVMDWIEPLLRRESYLALLLERPAAHERLLRLLGSAQWPARYVRQHPGVIDELASHNMLQQRFAQAGFLSDLQQRRLALSYTQEDDEEACLDLLRRAHHAEVFRTLARDVEGKLTVEQVADDLSALADAVLSVTVQWCWDKLKNKHQQEPAFAIIAYGKLGGKELGYGGDLDIVFVYEDAHENAPEIYAAFVRKLIHWLTVKTGEGDLFEIDTALRPNGNSGLLVTRFQAYADYQQQRGSNTAWTWEHQAMTRARCIFGPAALRQGFDQVRHNVITAQRDPEALRREIVAMREKMQAAHRPKQSRAWPASNAPAATPNTLADAAFDLKYATGGMLDLEFVVQFLVLCHAAKHPQLTANVGNIALLQRAENAGLLPEGMGEAAAHAYRELRRVQHQARLNEQPTEVDGTTLHAERDAIVKLWAWVLGKER